MSSTSTTTTSTSTTTTLTRATPSTTTSETILQSNTNTNNTKSPSLSSSSSPLTYRRASNNTMLGTTEATMPQRQQAMDQQMRSKFFHRIGIEAQKPGVAIAKNTITPVVSTAASASLSEAKNAIPPANTAAWLQSAATATPVTSASTSPAAALNSNNNNTSSRPPVPIYSESLKYDKVKDAQFNTMHSSKKQSSSPQQHKRRLQFRESVRVVPIPMRYEYSNRVRSRLWSSAMEIHENAARNTMEFASEGWDWRSVTEDERMYVCVATGELIHPCHYEADFQATPPASSSDDSVTSSTPTATTLEPVSARS